MTANSGSLPPLDKIELIQLSMRVFYFGVPGIVPGLGIPFAIVAVVISNQIKRRSGNQWNPAHRYLYWGTLCTRLGIILTLLAITFFGGALLLQILI